MYPTTAPSPPALEQTVATFLRKTRREHGLTMQDVADAGTKHGARWHKSSVNNIEQGASALTLSLLVPLCRALSDLTGEQISILDLLGDQKTVTLHRNSATVVSAESLKTALVGSETPRGATRGPRFSPVEARAADKLYITPLQLRLLCKECFGVSLNMRLTRLLGEDASPQGYTHQFEAAVADLKIYLNQKRSDAVLALLG